MVHPGFSDSRLEEMLDGGQMAARWREEEVRVLADDGLRSMLDQLDVGADRVGNWPDRTRGAVSRPGTVERMLAGPGGRG